MRQHGKHAQRPVVHERDLDRYAGQWVGVRDRRVVLAAASEQELLQHPEFTDDMLTVHLPPVGDRV